MFVRLSSLLSVLLGLGLGLLFSPAVQAQTADDVLRMSLREPATGTRAMGIGGAGTAGWADLSAMHTNPAGLGFFETSQVASSLSVLTANDESTFQIFQDGPSSSREGKTSAVRLNSLSGIYKMPTEQGSLVFGAGFNQTHTFDRTLSYAGANQSSSITDLFLPTNTEYDVDDQGPLFPDDVSSNILSFVAFQGGAIEYFQSLYDDGAYPFERAVLDGTSIRQEGTVRRDGRISEVNLAGAVEAAENVMVGASANITTGTYRFEHELVEIDQGENDNYEVIRNGQRFVGLERITFRERFESEHTGLNLRVGLSADLAPPLRLGISAETPTFVSVTEDFTDAFVRTDFREGGSLAYGDDPDETEAQGTFQYSITSPWRLGTGLAFHTDQLHATADVSFVDWSTMELDSESFGFPNENDRIQEDFGYVFNWRGGVEYRFDFGLAVRGGAAYRPDPRSFEITFADGDTHDRSRLFYSLGGSYALGEQIVLDVGWMQERTRDQFTPYTLTPGGTPPIVDAENRPVPIIDETVARNRFHVGVRYSF